MNKLFKQCLFLFCCIGIISCGQTINPTSVPETSLVNNDAIKETLPATSAMTNDNLTAPPWGINDTSVEALEPRQIAYGDIGKIWWSDDSEILYYGVLLEGNFAYDLRRQTTEKISVEDILNQTPQPAILQRLPPYYASPHISPSGNRAIYIKQSDTPLWPTISPDIEGGEASTPRYDLEMWLWEDGFSYSLGIIRQCWLSDAFWSNTEQKVVLVEFGIPMPVCFDSQPAPQAWLINLEDKSSSPLFPESEYPAVQVYGFIPEGTHLLHGFYSDATGANLSLLDVNELNSFMIDAPIEIFLEWISDTEILVEYRNEIEAPPYPVGILDLQSLEFCDLRISTNDQHVRHVKISPDKRWIAFTTRQQFFTPDGQQSFTPEKLWIAELDMDTCQ